MNSIESDKLEIKSPFKYFEKIVESPYENYIKYDPIL